MMSRNNIYSYRIKNSMDILANRLDTSKKSSKMENRPEDLM